jgi:hypothetical protein
VRDRAEGEIARTRWRERTQLDYLFLLAGKPPVKIYEVGASKDP